MGILNVYICVYIYSINVIYKIIHIKHIFLLHAFFASVTLVTFFWCWSQKAFSSEIFYFFPSESNQSTFYFKEISIKFSFLSSFPSKNYKEMSLIFCTSTVLETDWGWDPFAFPNFSSFFIHLPSFSSSLLISLASLSSVPSGLLQLFWKMDLFLLE